MYSLDVNFLKDREIRVYEAVRPQRGGVAAVPGDRRPLIFGLVGMLIPLLLMAGYWALMRSQVARLEARNAELDAELAQLQSQLQEISGIQGQIDAIRAENNAFVSVFNEIVPWSAILQDIRNRTPARVQITELSQTGGATSPVDPEATTPPRAGGISINGVACSFDDVNDFALVLQRSPLLQSSSVNIVQAQQEGSPLDPETQGRCPGTPVGQAEFLVTYAIQANITNTPAAQLVDELDRQGTVGLVTRLRALRETGVIE
jgi:type IV pilus assembly protein PilN